MSDDIRMVGAAVQPLKHSGQFRQQALSGYEASKEVDRQARITKPMDEPAFRRALDKLNQTLDNNKPLRDDVPRGYYLNIRV
ncbi:MAG: hypothetical protein HOG95_09560 [Rhodospirillaceae bacterium]|jgi:hypothetical protein|nr:hypothetical protein [Rhodospirillaceae bacterium]MBT5940168.1 hypothetical protein [Rhodospirillaceae bacterium]MBT7266550.1 hypothetical protein [Rhodospirillaceae bacterium]